jgi:hypothetical protein
MGGPLTSSVVFLHKALLFVVVRLRQLLLSTVSLFTLLKSILDTSSVPVGVREESDAARIEARKGPHGNKNAKPYFISLGRTFSVHGTETVDESAVKGQLANNGT